MEGHMRTGYMLRDFEVNLGLYNYIMYILYTIHKRQLSIDITISMDWKSELYNEKEL